ncbi:transposase [Atribacter laminatus]|uniref:Transposase IS200-like domain-containing protein n=1 Tax=Atribacter laminatus TaxID=2847778 RepID=A0A7T1F3G4_ATRLM|nr:transposase [Atribacter laminatus]QPM69083.1 hypothetical protein RT761_02311 [Atribacter laminatus]
MKYIQNLHHHRQPLRLKDYDYSQAGMYFITICTQNHGCLFGEIIEEKILLNEAGKMIEKWYVELINKFPDIEDYEYIIMPNHIHFIIHKIDQNKPDQQKMNNPRRGEPVCSPNICSRIDILPITNRADTQVRPYDDKNEKLNDEKNSMDLNCIGVDLGGHAGPPLRKIEKYDERITENKETGEYTMGSSIPKIVQWFKTMTTNEYIRRVKQDGWKPFNGRLWQRNYYEHIIRNEIELNQIREYIMNNPLKWLLDRENL